MRSAAGGVRPPPLAAGMALDVQGGYRAVCGRSRAPSDQTAALLSYNNNLYMISGERGTVALRHEARCTCQCCPGLLSARPMGGRCLCCCGMPHGCDWPAPPGASARLGVAIAASATRLDPTLSQELPHALARVMAHATRSNARLASRKCDRFAADSPLPATEAQRRMRHRRRMAGWS